MVGPFMQGMLLIGIIYWYSRSMMSMINDYYRGEFQRKLQVEPAKSADQAAIPINVDNFMDYVRELDVEPAVDTEFFNPAHSVCFTHSLVLMQFLRVTGAIPTGGFCPVQYCPEGSAVS